MIIGFRVSARGAEAVPPGPSGPQTDGLYRKVILDSDHDVDGDGRAADTLVNVMEIGVAQDGRVYYAERAGSVKVWILENGTAWTGNRDTQIVRIKFTGAAAAAGR